MNRGKRAVTRYHVVPRGTPRSENLCAAEDCSSFAECKGWCNLHYGFLRRNGVPRPTAIGARRLETRRLICTIIENARIEFEQSKPVVSCPEFEAQRLTVHERERRLAEIDAKVVREEIAAALEERQQKAVLKRVA